ncbi:MAG: NFACT family protein [Candidatus Thermoplasmatota archaeon]|nr:NFACT family protein [Candidatus Thermoplasmatota archaeon]
MNAHKICNYLAMNHHKIYNEIGSLTIHALVMELKKKTVNGRVLKIFHDTGGITIRIKGVNEFELVIIEQYAIFITDRWIHKNEPDSVANLFRKYLTGSIIKDVWQYKFDRTIIIEFESELGLFQIVIENFRTGAVSLLQNWIIKWCSEKKIWKSRTLLPNEKYVFPPVRADPLSMDETVMLQTGMASDRTIIQFLSSDVAMGKEVANYILKKLAMDIHFPAKEVDVSVYSEIYRLWISLLKTADDLHCLWFNKVTGEIDIINDNSNADNWQIYTTISDVLIERYKLIKNRENDNIIKEEEENLRKQKDHLYAEINRVRNEMDLHKKWIAEIYNNYNIFLDVLKQFGTAEVEQSVINKLMEKGMIIKYIPKEHVAIFKFNEYEIPFYLNKKIELSVNRLYEMIKGYNIQLKKIEQDLSGLEHKKVIVHNNSTDHVDNAKRKWYERYHWFVTSDGNIVISGKNAKDNDYVVKHYLKERDLFIHADIHGAAVTIVKSNNTIISEKSIYEACQFSICYSRAWAVKHVSADAFWVTPEQVSKSAPTGEYIAKGSWIIYGNKNYIYKIPLEMAIFIDDFDNSRKLKIVPYSYIKNKNENEHHIRIYPGDIKKEDFARVLSKKTGVGMDYIMSILPSGDIGTNKDLNLLEFK